MVVHMLPQAAIKAREGWPRLAAPDESNSRPLADTFALPSRPAGPDRELPCRTTRGLVLCQFPNRAPAVPGEP